MKRGSSPTQRAGSEAEDEALAYLCDQGLVAVLRNFHCRMGELDLVLHDGDTLVVAEVRLRRSRRFGSAGETVDYRKQRKLIRATGYLLQRYPGLGRANIRFDVLAIHEDGSTPRIQWVQNAFDASADSASF